jgi:hypothetical protein
MKGKTEYRKYLFSIKTVTNRIRLLLFPYKSELVLEYCPANPASIKKILIKKQYMLNKMLEV